MPHLIDLISFWTINLNFRAYLCSYSSIFKSKISAVFFGVSLNNNNNKTKCV